MSNQHQGNEAVDGEGSGSAQERVRQLTQDNERMSAVEAEVMRLLKSTSRERIVHDLRNVLNELVLLQALVNTQDESH